MGKYRINQISNKMTLIIRKVTAPNTTIEVNGTTEGTVVAGATVDIQLSNPSGTVTPTSVTQVGNDLQVVLPASGTPIDTDAQAFLTASGITNSTITSAINTLVSDLKTNHIWNKMQAIYPFVGGTASTHKWNLKDPRDLDVAFRLTMFGGLVHDSNGVKGNAVNAYMNTFLNPREVLVGARMSMGSYIRQAPTGGGTQSDGVRDTSIASWIEIDYTGKNTRNNTQVDAIVFTPAVLRLCQTVRSASNRLDMYINGTSAGNTTVATTLLNPNYPIHIFSRDTDGTAGSFNSAQTSFFYIASSLTQAEAVTLNTIVTTFQTTLGRNV
jgi:hypothetical protein